MVREKKEGEQFPWWRLKEEEEEEEERKKLPQSLEKNLKHDDAWTLNLSLGAEGGGGCQSLQSSCVNIVVVVCLFLHISSISGIISNAT